MAKQWYVKIRGEVSGPMSSKQLRDLASCGQLGPDSQVRTTDRASWARADRVRGLEFREEPDNPISSSPLPTRDDFQEEATEVTSDPSVLIKSSKPRDPPGLSTDKPRELIGEGGPNAYDIGRLVRRWKWWLLGCCALVLLGFFVRGFNSSGHKTGVAREVQEAIEREWKKEDLNMKSRSATWHWQDALASIRSPWEGKAYDATNLERDGQLSEAEKEDRIQNWRPLIKVEEDRLERLEERYQEEIDELLEASRKEIERRIEDMNDEEKLKTLEATEMPRIEREFLEAFQTRLTRLEEQRQKSLMNLLAAYQAEVDKNLEVQLVNGYQRKLNQIHRAASAAQGDVGSTHDDRARHATT